MLQKYANPKRFLTLANSVLPWTTGATVILIVAGLYFACAASPPDYQQGETVRIMYVHVPSAWMAMFAYAFIVVASAVGLIWKHPVAHVGALAAAP
ncbi:MAG: cytochrome c biogenesis protein CcsA, partial [Pseudomonadota bacterium]|nr:cytochrome c biogenesis protein CcsA [Pseudomonadota bacterium]